VAGVEPNTVVYVYCWAGDVGEAFRLRGEMEARGMLPSVATNNAVIWNLWDGNMKEINGLLNEMDERKVQADNVTCNTLINSYSKKGDMPSTCKVKTQEEDGGVRVAVRSLHLQSSLIHGFCKGVKLDEAKEALFEMLGAGLQALHFFLIFALSR
jgi:pentatricopeptide repeat protein